MRNDRNLIVRAEVLAKREIHIDISGYKGREKHRVLRPVYVYSQKTEKCQDKGAIKIGGKLSP
jgi:hypothetical protein